MACWLSLPTELKLEVVANLAPDDVDALAQSCLASYRACIPARFRVCSCHHCLCCADSFLVHKTPRLFFPCSFSSKCAPQLLRQYRGPRAHDPRRSVSPNPHLSPRALRRCCCPFIRLSSSCRSDAPCYWFSPSFGHFALSLPRKLETALNYKHCLRANFPLVSLSCTASNLLTLLMVLCPGANALSLP